MPLLQKFTSDKELLTIKEASVWASRFLERDIEESNILYLVQYGRLKKYSEHNALYVTLEDLESYYADRKNSRESKWKEKLGDDLNWALSFDHLREKDTTKHVHRLHPYKGKFIPQLVEYFIDAHTDNFKLETYFREGDIILDPFCGSGTTPIQASEMGIHAVGIDISRFNCMIADVKLSRANLQELNSEIRKVQKVLAEFEVENHIPQFDVELSARLSKFNDLYFPSPDFKYRVAQGEIDEETYGFSKEKEFLETYRGLVNAYGIKLKQDKNSSFLDKWYLESVRAEIDCVFEQIRKIEDIDLKKILAVILSRTIRSCRATTHSDLATLKEPQIDTYYCWKHKKICKPLFSIKGWFNRYAQDTVVRLRAFNAIRKDCTQVILAGDSRSVDIFKEIRKKLPDFSPLLEQQKIKGIFTSPPYVGQIDYHEQHAYAYDLFGFERNDDREIGPLFKGQGIAARQSYVDGIVEVLLNCRKFLAEDFDIFMVANDKYNLYPTIAGRSGLQIVNQFKRPVLNRTERDKSPYSEIIFHLKAVR